MLWLFLLPAMAAPRSLDRPWLDPDTAGALLAATEGGLEAWAATHAGSVIGGRVVVVLEVRAGASIEALLLAHKLPVYRVAHLSDPEGAQLELRLWPDELRTLAGLLSPPAVAGLDPADLDTSDLLRARPPFRVSPKQGNAAGWSGAVVSEGLPLIFDQESWIDARIRGQGLEVAVLDVGFAGAGALEGAELPYGLDIDDEDKSTGHGTAVAEIIHDVAPEAQLRLRAFATDTELLAAIEDLERDPPDVVNASIGFDNIWPADGQSPVSRAVDRLAQQTGVVWVGAAGNEEGRYRSGILSDVDEDGLVELGGVEEIEVPNEGLVTASLRWEDSSPPHLDLDLEALDEDGARCLLSQAPQDGRPGGLAYEAVSGGPCGDGRAIVRIRAAVADGAALTGVVAHLYVPDGLSAELATVGGTLSLPGDAAEVVTIGACDYGGRAARPYSSTGLTDDGRLKPDFCAPDGVSTATFGPGAFYGTSAATPHAAGLVALILDGEGGEADPALIRATLADRADDLDAPGPDARTGRGALHAGEAPRRCGCASPAEADRPPIAPLVLLVLGAVATRRRDGEAGTRG
jgi:MYXO-CTERM domain-containing protein